MVEMMFYNHLNGKWYTTLGGMSRTFRLLGYTQQQYYDEFIKSDEADGKCKHCGNQTKFYKFKYEMYCCSRCKGLDQQYAAKWWKSLSVDEYNDACNKISTSFHETHAGEGWLVERRQTYVDKFGVTETEYKSKLFLDRYENMTSEERVAFFDKSTSAQRVGNGRKFKKYFLNGVSVNVQGYEPAVLDILKKHFRECDISAGRELGFWRYESVEGKSRRYYPDIQIGNIVIEVKSKYTASTDENLFNKLKAVASSGHPVILAVINNIRQLEMFEKDLIETISSQAIVESDGRFNDYPIIGVGCKLTTSEVLGTHFDIGS